MRKVSISKEKSIEILKRLLVYVVGMFIIAFGVAVAVESNLGVSPVNAIPLVLSQKFTFFTMGTWVTIIFSLFVLLQLAILGKEFKWYFVFQFAVSTLFGFFVDAASWLGQFCIPNVNNYFLQLSYIFISILFIAFGIMLYLEGNIMSMPAEGVTVAMEKRFKKPLSTCKLIFDVTIIITAVVLSLIFFHKLQGIREGSILIAVGVGIVMKPIMKHVKPIVHKWVFKKAE